MRTCNFHQLLLVMALAFGQWLAIAHDYQHPLLGDSEISCQVCVHGQNLQAGPSTAQVLPDQTLADEAPLASRVGPVKQRRYHQASIRAPPAYLV